MLSDSDRELMRWVAQHDRQQSDTAADKAAASLTPWGTTKRYGEALKDPAMLTASFLPGPVGLAANTVYGVQGVSEAVKNPSAVNIGLAALGLLPGIGHLRGLFKGANAAKAAQTVNELRATSGAGDLGAAYGREVPYRAGSGVSSPGGAPAVSRTPETILQRARAQSAAALAPQSRNPVGSANDMLTNQRGIDWMHKEYEANKGLAAAVDSPSMMRPITSGSNRGVTASVRDQLVNQPTPGWQDVPLDSMGGLDAAASPSITRLPMGQHGDEFAGVKPYGPSTQLTPEEAAAAPAFEDQMMQDILDGILHARR